MSEKPTRRLSTEELMIACHDINEESISLIREYQHQIDHQEQVIQGLSQQVQDLRSLRWWQRPIAALYGLGWRLRFAAMERTTHHLRKDIRILIDKVIDLEEKLDGEDRP
jgi:uncharacterized coiled-coil protein SlyX